jgi:hypothetical protein
MEGELLVVAQVDYFTMALKHLRLQMALLLLLAPVFHIQLLLVVVAQLVQLQRPMEMEEIQK